MDYKSRFVGSCGHKASRRRYVAGYDKECYGVVHCSNCGRDVRAEDIKTGEKVVSQNFWNMHSYPDGVNYV